jgi:hypothetical protein
MKNLRHGQVNYKLRKIRAEGKITYHSHERKTKKDGILNLKGAKLEDKEKAIDYFVSLIDFLERASLNEEERDNVKVILRKALGRL